MADPLLSVNEYPTNDIQSNFQVNFAGGYISKEHVSVRFTDVTGVISQPTFTWVGDFAISVLPPPAGGGKLRIYRTTPADKPLVDFSDGSVVNELTLDLNAKQAVFLAAEVRDVISTAPELDDVLAAGAVATAAQDAAEAAQAAAEAARDEAEAEVETAIDTLSDELAGTTGATKIGWKFTNAFSILRTLFAKLSDAPISVKDWGAKGNGIDDDYAAINAAKVAALSSGKALFFPDGEYLHSGTLEFGYSHFRILFGGQVTLRHTGTGRAVSFDGGPTTSTQAVDIEFGWGCTPTLTGNVNTTDLTYFRAFHHSKVDVRLRDCTTGMRIEFAVCSHFRVNGSINQGPFPYKTPTNWLVVDRRDPPEATTDCTFDVVAEGSVSFGVDLICSQGCTYWGTSEGNQGGGLKVRIDSIKNIFNNFHAEQNGTGHHLELTGSYNIFNNCTWGGANNTGANTVLILGVRCHFNGGLYHNVDEVGYLNQWSGCQFTGTRSPNTLALLRACFDEFGQEVREAIPVTPTLDGAWQHSTGAGNPGTVRYWRDMSGIVHLIGGFKSGMVGTGVFTLPLGYRPEGTIWKKVYDPVAGADAIIAIGDGGLVQHISGATSAVPLDTITFPAKG